jgi:hypothetical protein
VEVTTSLRQVDDAEPELCWLLDTSEDDDPDTTTEPPELARDDEELETLTEEETEPPPDTDCETSTSEDDDDRAEPSETDAWDEALVPASSVTSAPASASVAWRRASAAAMASTIWASTSSKI